ncbi:MAG: PQQ-binding-like beta-propeller repeat protein [Planctomycetaceae bacterium]
MLAVWLLLASPALADDPNWPQFRGPGSRGVAADAGRTDTWSATEHVAWQRDITGRGWSCPIVWGERVFVTTAVSYGEVEEAKKGLYFGGERKDRPSAEHVWLVVCLDLNTGAVVWEKEVHRGVPEKGLHIKNSYASETPVTDGARVYAYFGNVGLFCLDFDGNLVWDRRWPAVRTQAEWGTAASPAVHDGRIYVVNDNQDQSFLEAVDCQSGSTVWRVDRDEKSNWSTPYVWVNAQRTEIVTPGSRLTRAYDLDGHELWQLGGASSITIGTPYSAHGLLYVSSGYILDKRHPLWAVRPGATGDISLKDDETANASIAWCQKQAAPYNPTTLVYGDLLYVLMDRGLLSCYDAKSGELVYAPQRLGGANAYTSSPWAYDGKVFCLDENGTTTVVGRARIRCCVRRNPLGGGHDPGDAGGGREETADQDDRASVLHRVSGG